MTREEAIKYLQQIYPNGGHCWLDEQRIMALDMAIQALSVSLPSDVDEAAGEYLDGHKPLSRYNWGDLMDAFKAGARWRDAQIPKLPDDVEETAEKYRRESYNKATLPNIDGPMPEYGGSIKDAFKAGTEWMAGQGETQKCRIKADYDSHGADYGIRYLYVRMPDDSPIGEEVIVQIRKK